MIFSCQLRAVAGVLNIVMSIQEGLHNMPQLYGSDVRQREDVTDFASGLKAAGKACSISFGGCYRD